MSHRHLPLVLLLMGCPAATPPPEVASFKHQDHRTSDTGVPRHDAALFHRTVSLRGADFTADETSVIVSMDTSGIFNAYALPIGKGEAAQLTHSTTESIFVESAFPDDDRFLYRADAGGDERDHLFVMKRDGTVQDLTPGTDLKARFLGWSSDGRWFFVATNERDPRAFDVYRYATDGYQRELLFENRDSWSVDAVSPDGRHVALSRVHGNADSDIHLFDASAPERAPQPITPHEGEAWYRAITFTPDGDKLVYATDAHGEFMQAHAYQMKTGEHALLYRSEWDIVTVRYSRHGAYVAVFSNEDARTVVRLYDAQTGQELDVPQLPRHDIEDVHFSRSETKLLMYVGNDRASTDLHVFDLATRTLHRLTDTMNKAIDPAHLVEAEVVRYPSFDGLEIPAILYRPKGATTERPVPALVWVHGGPGGQSRRGFYSPTIQHLVNHGYAVLAVNNRGSSGYGKTFFHMDDRKHGEVDLDDCVWGRKYLASRPWVDGDRIGIIGGSYGGYMVVAALAFRPQVFAAGIDIFGVTNWVRTLESIPPWWTAFAQRLYDELGDPRTDGERLRRISPLFHAANIVKPLLVVQGANDPRVLEVESAEIVAAVQRNGVPVEYLLFPDEGHGFDKKENRIAASRAFVRFLHRHLVSTEQSR